MSLLSFNHWPNHFFSSFDTCPNFFTQLNYWMHYLYFIEYETKETRKVTIEHGGLYRGYRDTGYLPFYFQGYRILSILLPGI